MIAIKKIALYIMYLFVVSPSAYALEYLNENDLAQTIGQDGVSIAFVFPESGWTAQEISLTDKTGIPNTIKPGYDFNSAAIVAKSIGIRSCLELMTGGGCITTGLQGINMDLDVTGDANQNGISDDPMLNIRVNLLNANKLRVYIDKITLRNGLGGNESTLIDFNHPDAANDNEDYFDLLLSDGQLFNIQLGNESSGHMISFGSTVINTVDFGEVRLTDKTDTGVGGNGRNLRFNLRLDNINLTDAGLDVGSKGLVFTTPNLTNMNVTFGNISAGTSATNMGTIGIQGLNLSKHALIISGKS